MGLLDLKTDLKSLKYGNDQRGGGSSNQPYITTPIPDGFGDTAPDFLLRNGYLNPINSLQDVSRLTRLFLDTKSPNGFLFTVKQELLERQNPIQANTDRIYSPLNTIAQAGVLSIGYHLNKQGLNPFTPGYYDGGRSGYFFSTRAGSNVDGGVNGGENRLTLLYTSKVANQSLETFTINPFGVTGPDDQNNLLSYSGGPNSILGFGKTNIRIQNPTRTVVPYEENTFNKNTDKLETDLDYLVPRGIEPGNIIWNYDPRMANGGVSNAAIFIYDLEENQTLFYPDNSINKILNRTGLEGEDAPDNIYLSSSIITRDSYYKNKNFADVIIPNLKSFNTASTSAGFRNSTPNEILTNLQESPPNVFQVPDDIVQGKRKTTTLASLTPQYFILTEGNGNVSSTSSISNIQTFNREDKYGTSTTYYTITPSSDRINITDVLQPTGSDAGNQQKQIDDLKQQDLVKFYFEINNNDSLAATQNWFLFFRAYLNDLGDSYKPDWQSYKYIGRAENFYKYSGFSRDISLAFTIYAHSRAEMAPIYKKLNYLVGTTAPDYSEAGYMRGNFVNLTVGDWLSNVPGIIQGINLKPSFDAGWDIDRNEIGTPLNDSLQLPRMIEVDLQFTPIHTFTPRFTSTFIG
jgi:hypothetical protein